MLTPIKMSRTLLMFSTMIIPTIQKITFIVLDVLVVLDRMALQSLSSQLKVRVLYPSYCVGLLMPNTLDSKQVCISPMSLAW